MTSEKDTMLRPIHFFHWIAVRVFALLVFAGSNVGCEKEKQNDLPQLAQEALKTSSQFTLFSLDPETRSNELTTNELLHGYRILGKMNVTDSASRQRIKDLLENDVSHWDGDYVMCFNPRHALRINHKALVLDFVICYECKRIEIYADNTRIAMLGITGAQKPWDSLLKAANIPLPKPQP